MKVTKCPACNSNHFKEIGEFSDSIALKGKNCEFLQEPYAIHECLTCGLHYKNNILTPEQFSLYYNDSEFERWSYSKLYPPEKIIEQRLLSKKEKLCILDFGCSEGRLLGQLLNNHICYGFDINPQSLDIARSKGMNTFSSFEELKNTKVRFDTVLLIDVFEHLLNPMETIDLLLKLLKEDGEIIISTGYADSWAYKKQPAEFWYTVFPEHVCILSDRFIEFLCEKKGLKVNYKSTTSHYKTPIKQKFTYYTIYYSYWSTLKLRRFKFLYNIYPFKTIFKWKSYPFFPITKDHIVVALKNK
jgi:SAM-dependent methyltransferase